jgi:acetyltransferase AlgX (SGNH hydrolase-like protein)
MKRLLPNLALGAGAALALGLLVEASLRLFAPQVPPYTGLFRPDAAVGFRQVPFFRGRIRLDEHTVRVETNSLGFRDREYTAATGDTFRILGLGDSFAFGVGVEDEETYLARIESALRERRVDVVNAGLVGAGPDTEARLLEAAGPGLQPDLLLLGFYVGNDLRDAMLGTEELEVRDGSLFWRPAARARWERVLRPGRLVDPERPAAGPLPENGLLRTHSHAYRMLTARLATLRARWVSQGVAVNPLNALQEEAFCLRDYPPELEEGWNKTRDALDRIRAWSDRYRAALMIVVIPFRGQVELAEWRQFQQAHGLTDADVAREKPQALLNEWAERTGVAMLDLLPALRRARERGAELYYRRDPHWTAHGHAVAAAEILAQPLVRALLDERRPSRAGAP